MLLDVAVAPAQLHSFGADPRALLGTQAAGQRGLAREARAVIGAAGGAIGQQAHALELDADVGDPERDGLAVGDRLAEGGALVDVGDDVVEHGLRGADGERAPRDPRALDALAVDRAGTALAAFADAALARGALAAAEQRRRGDARVLERDAAGRRRAQPHRGLGLDRQAL